MARSASKIHDDLLFGLTLGDDDRHNAPLAQAEWLLRQERESSRKREWRWLPVALDVVLMSAGPGRSLALAYGASRLRKAFAKISGAVPHGYWDNRDPEEGLTAGAWSQRRRDWEKVLGESFELSPAEAGVCIKLVSSKYASSWTPIFPMEAGIFGGVEFAPAARAARLAEDLCHPSYTSALPDYKARLDGSSGADMSGFVRMFDKWREAAAIAEVLPLLDGARARMPGEALEAEGAALRLALQERRALAGSIGAPTARKRPRM